MADGGSIALQILTSAPVRDEWTLCSYQFIPRRNRLDVHCIGGWVGPRAGLKFWRNKNLLLLPGARPVHIHPAACVRSLESLPTCICIAESYLSCLVSVSRSQLSLNQACIFSYHCPWNVRQVKPAGTFSGPPFLVGCSISKCALG
jgi:hypothetical protein